MSFDTFTILFLLKILPDKLLSECEGQYNCIFVVLKVKVKVKA
jgi:hypothetical protein